MGVKKGLRGDYVGKPVNVDRKDERGSSGVWEGRKKSEGELH